MSSKAKNASFDCELGTCKVTVKLCPDYIPGHNIASIKVSAINMKNDGPVTLEEALSAIGEANEDAQRSVLALNTDPKQKRLSDADKSDIGVRIDEMRFFLDPKVDLKDPGLDARIKLLTAEELDYLLVEYEGDGPNPKVVNALVAEKKRRKEAGKA